MTPSLETLHSYDLLDAVPHPRLVEFAADYYWKHKSWVTRLHRGISLIALLVLVAIAVVQQMRFLLVAGELALALVALLLVVLPLHEAVHAVGYRLVGARDVRWSYSWFAVYVLAHHFVVGRRAFVFVALAPFVLLNGVIIACAVVWPQLAFFFTALFLLHTAGASGDWALMNYYWFHRRRTLYTYDDVDHRSTYFYAAW